RPSTNPRRPRFLPEKHGAECTQARGLSRERDCGGGSRGPRREHACTESGKALRIWLNPDGGRVAVLAKARDALANLEGLEFEFVQIDDFAALAEAALHEESRQGFLGFERSREIDIPEVGARIGDVDGINKAVGLAIDLGHDACAGGFILLAIALAFQRKLLAGEKFFGELDDAAIAADE